MNTKIVVIDVLAALVTHVWFRNHEPDGVVYPIAALLTIPTSIALLGNFYLPGVAATAAATVISIMQTSLIYFTTLSLSIIAYRLSPYHPLSAIPGPTLWKVSKMWSAFVAYGGDLHREHKALHEKYGPVVRVGPNEISVTEKDFIPLVLGYPGLPKGPLWTGRIDLTSSSPSSSSSSSSSSDPTQSTSLISVRNVQRHAHLRKPWNKAFGAGPMVDYCEILMDVGEELCACLLRCCVLSNGGRGRVDLAQWMSFFSFDYMGQLAFDGEFKLMRDGDKNNLWRDMEIALLSTGILQHVPWLAKLLHKTPFRTKGLERFLAFSYNQAVLRSAKEMKRKDLFYHLLNAADPATSDDATDTFPLIAQSTILTIIAGSDTTATVLSNVMFYLILNPRYLSVLRNEIEENFSDLEMKEVGMGIVDVGKLGSMVWLNAIINEALRLQPPVPTSIQRGPGQGSGGQQLGNLFLPEGTGINIPAYTLHRDPRYFSPHAEEFWPERWLPSTHSNSNSKHDGGQFIHDTAAFIPFSHGPANCAGKTLAMIELRYVVVLLVSRFDVAFDFAEGFTPQMWEEELKDRFILAKGRLPVVISPREKLSG